MLIPDFVIDSPKRHQNYLNAIKLQILLLKINSYSASLP